MHNKKNIVLMFLIVMLSFAIVSEVSAVSPDDAEPSESGLNVPIESGDSHGTQMPSERFSDVSNVPVDDTIDYPHSNNNQTSFSDTPSGVNGNKNFYEQMPADHESIPPMENAQDKFNDSNVGGQKQINKHIGDLKTFDDNKTNSGEKMKNLPNDLSFDRNVTPNRVDNDVLEVNSKVISELIGLDNVSVAFKNSKKDHNMSDEFGGVLPQKMPEFNDLFLPNKDKSFDDNNVGMKGNSTQFGKDLSFKKDNFPINNISLAKSELPRVNNTIPNVDDDIHHFEFTNIDKTHNELDFLPYKNETQNFEYKNFPNTKTFSHNDTPNRNSTKPDFSRFSESMELKHEGNPTLPDYEGSDILQLR